MAGAKTPSEVNGFRDLKRKPTGTRDILYARVPRRAACNFRHCHFLPGASDVRHLGSQHRGQGGALALRQIENQRFATANRYYATLDKVNVLLAEASRRSAELQAKGEAIEAANEELQASAEEMEATNEELRATAAEVERASAYLKTLMNSMMDVVLTTDPAGNIAEVNQATERISGYSREELVGKPLPQFFTDADRAQAGLDQIMAEGEVANYELTVAAHDGREVPVSFNATVLRDAQGRITNVLGNARDITAQKKAEEELRKVSAYNRSLIEANRDALVTISPTGTITDVNSATEVMTGRSRAELIGTDFSSYFTEPEKAKAGYQQALKNGSVRDYALEIQHRHGHATAVLYNASVHKDETGRVLGVFAAARDVSKRKRTEDALASQAEDLSRSNADLEQFAYVASHDLQEPLRMVTSYLQLLERRYKGKLDDDADEFIAYAVDGAKRMGILISDLLAFSRVGAGPKSSEPTDCEQVLESALASLKAAIDEGGAEITHDPLPTLPADGSQLTSCYRTSSGTP